MPYNDPGAIALRQWIAEDKDNRTDAAIGRACGVTGQAVSQWRRGLSTPTADKQRLLRAAGVPWPRETATPDDLRAALANAAKAGAEFRRLARGAEKGAA